MTERTQIAAMLLAGLMAKAGSVAPKEWLIPRAVEFADALLAELRKERSE